MIAAPPVFGYWTTGVGEVGREFPASSLREWRKVLPQFKVFGDDVVIDALAPWGRSVQDLFMDIRIPACRADIARLALLQRFGGTFVDAHTAPGDLRALFEYLIEVRRWEMVVCEMDAHLSPFCFARLFNSPMSARQGAAVMGDLIESAFSNVIYCLENGYFQGDHSGRYSIFAMTGPTLIRDVLVDFSHTQWRMKQQYRDRIKVHAHDPSPMAPFALYKHTQYRSAENHWTKRELREPLFFSQS